MPQAYVPGDIYKMLSILDRGSDEEEMVRYDFLQRFSVCSGDVEGEQGGPVLLSRPLLSSKHGH